MEKKKQPATKTSKSKSADWTTLKGKFFHTFDQDGFVKDQSYYVIDGNTKYEYSFSRGEAEVGKVDDTDVS
jgi:hypothetical protein